jgi:TonB family protein
LPAPDAEHPVQPVTPDQSSMRDSHPAKTHGPQISTNLVARDAGQRIAGNRPVSSGIPRAQLNQIIDRISRIGAAGSPLTLNIGTGPSQGDSSYEQIVKDIYSRHWDAPAAAAAPDGPVTTVSVTIANSGKVAGAKIIKISGDEVMDSSVQRVLEQVTFIAPFSTKGAQRTYTINFRLRSRLAAD